MSDTAAFGLGLVTGLLCIPLAAFVVATAQVLRGKPLHYKVRHLEFRNRQQQRIIENSHENNRKLREEIARLTARRKAP